MGQTAQNHRSKPRTSPASLGFVALMAGSSSGLLQSCGTGPASASGRCRLGPYRLRAQATYQGPICRQA